MLRRCPENFFSELLWQTAVQLLVPIMATLSFASLETHEFPHTLQSFMGSLKVEWLLVSTERQKLSKHCSAAKKTLSLEKIQQTRKTAYMKKCKSMATAPENHRAPPLRSVPANEVTGLLVPFVFIQIVTFRV